MAAKQDFFEKVLREPYNHEQFIQFVREFLTGINTNTAGKYNKEYSNFSFYVDGYYHIGTYQSDDGEKIAVLSVNLKRGETVERARSMQRNFVKPLLEKSGSAGALVAFYTSETPEKWRLSFIRLDYEFSKGKISEKLTPAKRYSYLVGKGEPCNTARQRLFPIFRDDTRNPGLDELEDAFSVEKVSQDFFKLYEEKYHEVREYLEGNDDFMNEAEEHGFTSEQFAKKLLGQIVFLYFIQKKGWLGVGCWPSELTEKQYNNLFYTKGGVGRVIKEYLPKVYQQNGDNYRFLGLGALKNIPDDAERDIADHMPGRKPWGSGDKSFVRTLFEFCQKQNRDFFDDYLEPLFYDTLNKNRGEMSYSPHLHCRIPFLNGGLFEELKGYDWRNNDFNIPNDLFSNKDKKGDYDADGILDIFDRYNFTMNEDEPMEREVAIDPEMLGKVFENLLDVKDRKSKGAFYTPREIVHYMCQETLINYLVGKTGISEGAIRDFILYGEYFKDEDTEKTKAVTDEKTGKKKYVLDESKDLLISDEIFSFKKKINRLEELDKLLENVKVADPAVGSGAFPLGMLNEIVKARDTLTAYLSIGMNAFQKKSFIAYNRKLYDLKVNTIRNCLFACDIEPSAVDIAKLRLWLSIVIDDEITDETGNGEFDAHSKPKQLPNLDCNIICGNSLIDEFNGVKLIDESELLGNVSDNSQIHMYQAGADALISELIELQRKLFYSTDHNDKAELKQRIQKIYETAVLEQMGGDPALVQAYKEAMEEPSSPFVLWPLYFPTVFRDNGGFDVVIGNPPYVLLQDLFRDQAVLDVYKEKYVVATYKVDLYHLFIERGIDLLKEDGEISLIVPSNFTTNNYCVELRRLMLEKLALHNIIYYDENVFQANVNNLVFVGRKTDRNDEIEIVNAKKQGNEWIYSNKVVIDQEYFMNEDYIIVPISGGDSASIIKKMEKHSILKEFANVNFGMQLRNRKKFEADVTTDERLLTKYHKKCYGGKDVVDYFVSYSGQYCYFKPDEAKCGGCWDENAQFANPKLLVRQIGTIPIVGIDEKGYCVLNAAFMISGFKEGVSPYYLLGILTSSLIRFYWLQKFSDNRKQFPKIKGTYLEKIPIAREKKTEERIEREVKNILDAGKDKDISKFVAAIDNQVYQLYSLTEEEIEYVAEKMRV